MGRVQEEEESIAYMAGLSSTPSTSFKPGAKARSQLKAI